MPIDYKKTQKQFYSPKNKPEIIEIPSMKFIYVDGHGNPNEQGGQYQKAIESIYAIAYTLKMGLKKKEDIKGYEDYVVLPLEGFWTFEGLKGYDVTKKDDLVWRSLMRIPDFITKDIFDWAIEEAQNKKGIDLSHVGYMDFYEGLVVQILHIGDYDSEIVSVELMNQYIKSLGYEEDFSDARRHHEIYLSDPRKVEGSKLKTILRHPIKKVS